METIYSMFATFVLFVSGVVAITDVVNKLFKVSNSTAKLIISWAISIAASCVGFALQVGIFADFGDIHSWIGWVKTVLIGFGAALAANKVYDMDEIWALLQKIFPFFKK